MTSKLETAQPATGQPSNPEQSKFLVKNSKNVIFAIALIILQIIAFPIYGVLFSLSSSLQFGADIDGVLLVGMTTILLIIGFGLINSYIVRSSFSGITFTLVIFALTLQTWFLFRAFWNKTGANDYDHSAKTFSTSYNAVTLSNQGVDRHVSSDLPSGPIVQGIACAISLAVAFNSVVGRIGLLQIFFLVLFGSFFYEINAELIWRWFITDNGFGCRIFLFGSVVGLVTSLLLGRRQTTVGHASYHSQYKIMSFGLLGFLFLIISLPMLNTIGVYSGTTQNNAILFASNINAWLAVFASTLGTFTANAIIYRKFFVFDLIFSGTAGAFACAMSFDTAFNPCIPLIVGFIVSFLSSLYPSVIHKKINEGGVLFSFPHLNRFLIPAFIASIVSAVIQACGISANGAFEINQLPGRTKSQQGGWQIIGLLITIGIALIAGLIIGIIYKIINNYTAQDQFNDEVTYSLLPHYAPQTD